MFALLLQLSKVKWNLHTCVQEGAQSKGPSSQKEVPNEPGPE